MRDLTLLKLHYHQIYSSFGVLVYLGYSLKSPKSSFSSSKLIKFS